MAIDSDCGRCVGAGISSAAAPHHSLADETPLRVVRRLARGEARVLDLTTQFGQARSTASKRLACLRDHRAEGRQSFRSLTRPELMDLLASAEHLPAATGHAVPPCPPHGPQPAGATAGHTDPAAGLDHDLAHLGEPTGDQRTGHGLPAANLSRTTIADRELRASTACGRG
ncbi:hypothetical protein ACIBP6_09875 [Nonomuraea terrae]|uniref:hypothetical protein n=1 Tax=Nonomuraea terrae TaxID=2530383 RepID=UPI0037A83C4B